MMKIGMRCLLALLAAVSFTTAVAQDASKLDWVSKVGTRDTPTSQTVFWVNSYGAKADGKTLTTKAIQKAIDAKDSVGGIIECVASNLPAGLGEPFFDSVESVIAHLALSIPAVKAIEFGAGFKAARMFGSEHNDPHTDAKGSTSTNHAGGVVGGLTTGNDLVFRIAVKPTSSTPKEQNTFNLKTGEIETLSIKGRHDLCIALRVPVVLEAVTAIAVADLLLFEQRVPRIL